MSGKSRNLLPQILGYLFAALAVAGAALFALNLWVDLGNGLVIRGWIQIMEPTSIKTMTPVQEDVMIRLFDMGKHREFILLQLGSAATLWKGWIWIYMIMKHLAFAAGAMISLMMARIFYRLCQGRHFYEKNICEMRQVAGWILAVPLSLYSSSAILVKIITLTGSLPGQVLAPAFSPEYVVFGLLVSAVVFAMTSVFQEGRQLQLEQDLTI